MGKVNFYSFSFVVTERKTVFMYTLVATCKQGWELKVVGIRDVFIAYNSSLSLNATFFVLDIPGNKA